MTVTPVPEEVLVAADDLTISDLLAQPELANVTIRFLCGARKALLDSNPVGELAEIETQISRIYHRVGYERRCEAFDSAPAREVREPKASKFQPAPAKPAAPDFTPDCAVELARNVIQGWVTKEEPKRQFSFDEIKRAVANIHTSKGARDWSALDSETVTSGAKRWEQTLQGAMRKLRDADEIAYRASKSDYFVLR